MRHAELIPSMKFSRNVGLSVGHGSFLRELGRALYVAHLPTPPSYPPGHSSRNRLTLRTGHVGTITITPPAYPFTKVESCPICGNNGKVNSSMANSRSFDTWADPKIARFF